MDESTKNSPCKECTEGDGAQCRTELEHLRRHLADRDSHIIALEAEFIKTTGRASNLEEQLDTWREKYERLYDSHKRVQKLNQVLEDKLLQMVDKMKGEKHQLTKDIATLSVRLAESKHNYGMLQKENERYKNDMNLAIQLLQCKPDNFVSHKLDNLSVDTQARVSQYVMSKSKPPGSSHSKNGNDMETFDSSEYEFNISASLMSKILEDSIQDTVTKHCDTCSCSNLQSQPFCYNESHYSVATQTALSGEMKNSLCLNCNTDVKSGHSGLSVRSVSPHGVKLINEKTAPYALPGPLYIVSQPVHNVIENTKVTLEKDPEKMPNEGILNDIKIEENMKYEANVQKEISKIGEEIKQIRKNSAMNMEPAVHHKLCDRTKTPISSKKSTTSLGNEDALMKDLTNPLKDTKTVAENQIIDNISIRKNSLSSMGAISRTSSVAKSTTSTHKSNTQVGPGPRFCSLRMHPGSKNILLDNAQPDVPPVLYRRQSKCNENNIFKEVEGVDNFVNLAKKDENTENGLKHDNLVVESTLIDVHVDNNNKETSAASKTSSINPILMNVSSSPLQPLKTHNFSNGSEQNNNPGHSITSQTNTSEVDNLLNGFNSVPTNDIDIKTKDEEGNVVSISNKTDLFTPTDNHDVKIFNFDRYEQNKLSSQYVRPLKMIDMSNLHSLENTRISKDLPPQGELPKIIKKEPLPPKNLSTIVNVYPNLTQTHLKVNESKKVFTNEQSTSSLSSDDSAAILQKQQLLRVAEWVEQNLEQQNNLNDPLEEDVSFNTKLARRESRINRLTDTLNELALNMPHPVSKYSKSYTRDDHKNWVHSNPEAQRSNHSMPNNSAALPNAVNHFAKETEFPVEGDEPNTKTSNAVALDENVFENIGKNLSEALKNGDREITAEELARMEYNVKKFLLSGPQWANPESVGRSRRTSSKTETDV